VDEGDPYWNSPHEYVRGRMTFEKIIVTRRKKGEKVMEGINYNQGPANSKKGLFPGYRYGKEGQEGHSTLEGRGTLQKGSERGSATRQGEWNGGDPDPEYNSADKGTSRLGPTAGGVLLMKEA